MSGSTLTRPLAARLLLWLLGGWLFLAAVTGYLAGTNFAILKFEKLDEAEYFYGNIPQEKQELALRYAASELNRVYFAQFYALQMGIAIAALLLYMASGRTGKKPLAALGAAAVISAVLLFWLTPEIIDMGRKIDKVAREPITEDREAFNVLHHLAVGLDVSKMALILGAAVPLLRNPEGSPR
ncbi:MAG: hypothetical protein HRU14_04345 [Planctomycetes bacterium]|nr:hypothetical protein [Planctomycetota bacterium]